MIYADRDTAEAPWAFVVAGLIAALSAALLIRTMTTLFKIEKIIFGRSP